MNRDTKIVIVFMVTILTIMASGAIWQSTSEMGQQHEGDVGDFVGKGLRNFTDMVESSLSSPTSSQQSTQP